MRRVKPLTLLALALVIGLGSIQPSFAQQKPLPTREDLRNVELFKKFFASAAHRAQVRNELIAEEKTLTPDCSAVSMGDLADFHPYGPVRFTPDEKLESGIWLEVWSMNICGETKRRSILFSASNTVIKAMPFLPGRTNVDPVLGRDLLPRAGVSARLYVGEKSGKPCTTAPLLFDTKLVSLPRDARLDTANAPADVAAYLKNNVSEIWREHWYFRACDHIAEVKIMFMIKNDGGTTFTITKGAVTRGS